MTSSLAVVKSPVSTVQQAAGRALPGRSDNTMIFPAFPE